MTVFAEKVQNRIWAQIPYNNGQGPTFAKRIRGASWNKSHKVWTYPLEWNTCLRLREVFGDALCVGHELSAWAAAEKIRVAGMTELAQQRTASLAHVPAEAPALAEAFSGRTYQQVGARFCAEAGATLLGDQPRLGKTLEILGAIVERNVPGDYLLLVPSTSIQIVWEPEIKRWLGDLAEPIAVVGSRAQREAAFERGYVQGEPPAAKYRFFICNHEMAQIRLANAKTKDGARKAPEWPQLFSHDWQGIIVDESHEMLIGPNNPKTMSAQRFGAMQLAKTNPDALKIAASGTPARGKEWQLWSTYNWLRPDTFTSFWRWAEEYFEVDSDGYGKVVGAFKASKQAAWDREVSTIMLRRTTQEVRPELPARQYGGTPLEPGNEHSPFGVWLPLSGAQRRAYDQLAASATVPLEDGGELDTLGILAEMTRAKQLADAPMTAEGPTYKGSNKFEWLVEFLSERGITGDADTSGTAKIVVGSQFAEVLHTFAKGLGQRGIRTMVLTGSVSQAKRPAMVKQFYNDPEARVFLIQTQTGGVAITLDCADEMVVLDETWIPDEQEQLEYRIDNAGGEVRPKMIWYVRSLGTIDEGICRVTGSRERAVKWVLDGRRGVAYIKDILSGGVAK
jgi:SNF2 family DNA or RNA helicase